ncbi:MAG: adenylate/guanylate cyclase domain-containing protein [Verrucomicrobiota bacterium]
MRQTTLVAFTFLAVAASTAVVGLIVVPWLIHRGESFYLQLQAEENARRARQLAQFASFRLDQGLEQAAIATELQAYLKGAEVERGYSCVVDQDSTTFVCHPMDMALGMGISSKKAEFAQTARAAEVERSPWEVIIPTGLVGTGFLSYPEGHEEIVHMESIPNTRWTVTTHENTGRVYEELDRLRSLLISGSIVVGLLLAIPASIAARAVGRNHERKIESERNRSEALLLNILPPNIADRLKNEERTIADRHPTVTVLFADIVGFTPIAADTPANQLVEWLNLIFTEFDDICHQLDLEKIKTIGDAYMVCGGLNPEHGNQTDTVIRAASQMIETLHRLAHDSDFPNWQLRVGVHTGELVAGVIGKRKFSYDVWGDVVNTAARLEASGVAGKIQLSAATRELLPSEIQVEDRGLIELKGKGQVQTYLVDPVS